MAGQQLSVTEAVPRRRVRAGAGLLWMVTSWVLLGFVGSTLLLPTGGELHKFQFMSVLSGSMVPALEVGDMVIAEVVGPDHLRSGDLATFRDPDSGKLITHRVQSILWRGEIADVITRGDRNTVGENWSVTADGRVGKVVLRVPRVGYAVGVLGTTPGQLALAGLAGVLGVWILVVIWRPARGEN